MIFRKLLLGAAALALLASPAFAEDYAGGAIKSTEVGGKEMLTDANGMTLYVFDKDTAGVSNCNDTADSKCATSWPPLMAAAGASPDGDYTIITRADGTQMWAYQGKPLYMWAKDTKAGDTTGDGIGGVWHIAYEE